MSTLNFNISNIKIEHLGDKYNSHRYGFTHTSSYALSYDTELGTITKKSVNKAHYINRTWENYTYQTSRLGAIQQLIDKRIESLKQEFLQLKGRQRMSKNLKDEFEVEIKDCPILKALYEKRDEVRGEVW